ncbi:hypothetical protein L2X99_00740 [Microbacterium sp. KUDC0406]|uniref:hypothetical protein n=1 Tax=Microbacterium sp. KUDC0406 TaxID=2909588 RepID=UPI001F244A72|nr:hypothetical protein [Microbacterium sp. KUDC0406]UJP10283.1 hypothetical protein L2X99_00740 [Microbacterium sp. KUDC0406]
MMPLDPFTVNVLVAVTTLAAGVMYLLETMLRHESRAGQIWVLAYLCGMLTVISYLVWKSSPEPLIAIAVGNAALVATVGCLWLGCLRYNGRGLVLAGTIVAVSALAVVALSLLDGTEAGDWAGSLALFTGIAVFAVLGAVESRRGHMGGTPTTAGLTVVLGIVAAYYGVRCAVFAIEGPDGELFRTWFSSSITGTITIVLMIVALVTTTTLRNNSVTPGAGINGNTLQVSPDGVLTRRSFALVMEQQLAFERDPGATIGVIAFRADDLPQIGIAFGSAEQEAVIALCREAVRRYAPSMTPVGEYGLTGIMVAMEAGSAADVRRAANRIQRRMLDDLAERGSAVIPVIGVGIAMADTFGGDVRALLRAAFEAAGRASTSSEASVMIAE